MNKAFITQVERYIYDVFLAGTILFEIRLKSYFKMLTPSYHLLLAISLSIRGGGLFKYSRLTFHSVAVEIEPPRTWNNIKKNYILKHIPVN